MRLYRGKVPTIAEEVTEALISAQHIEVAPDMVGEVQLDIESVLNEYRRVDREILEEAKDMVTHRGLDYSHTHRLRQRLAEQRGFGVGDNAIQYLVRQLIELLLHTRNVEEVFAEDHDLRRTMREVIRKHTELDRDLDRQVRAKIRHLQDGTQDFDVEYQKVMSDLRRVRNLE